MRRIRLVKVVIPDLVARTVYNGETFPDYRCPECGFGVAEDYSHCPHCGAELDWKLNI